MFDSSIGWCVQLRLSSRHSLGTEVRAIGEVPELFFLTIIRYPRSRVLIIDDVPFKVRRSLIIDVQQRSLPRVLFH